MAAKLTFEAKMTGMEQVLDLLKRAEDRLTDFGRTGSYSVQGVDARLKEFQQSLKTITDTQQGIGGLFNSFNDLNRKSNEFLGKAYKGVIDGMKQEVKAFEQEADRITSKIKDAEQALEQFRSRRNAMNEKDYEEGMSRHQRELGTIQSQRAAVASEKANLQRETFFNQPVNQGAYDFASRYGMGQYATVAGAMRLGVGALGLPATAGAILQGVGNLGLQFGYTREADTFLAQQRLNRQAAGQAQGGDPTTLILKDLGIGLEQKASHSIWARSKAYGQALLDNSLVRGAAVGAGTFLAGTSATFGFGAIPSAFAAIGAGSAAAASAGNRTYSQFLAEGEGALRARDSEMYGFLLGKGGAAGQVMRESSELQSMQRIYGVQGTHNLTMTLAGQGVGADRANPMINQMIAQGLLPGNYLQGGDMASTNNMFYRYSLNQNVQNSIFRSAALQGGSLSGATNRALGLFNAAGLNGAQDIAARSALGDFASGLAAERGGTSADISVAGSAVAANVATSAAGFNRVEAVQQGIANYQSQTNLMQGGSSAMDTLMISKLRMLGVTNAAAIAAFIKLDPRLATTQKRIAAYTGKSEKEVRDTLVGAAQAYNSMYETVLGKEQMDKFKATTGIDMQTLFQSGVKAGENTAAGGGTFGAGLEKSFEANTGNAAGVAPGRETMADRENKAAADQQKAIDDQMRQILQGTGKTVTDEITKAVIRGFEMTTEEVRKAGDRLIKERQQDNPAKPNGQPYLGPQRQKMSSGQTG